MASGRLLSCSTTLLFDLDGTLLDSGPLAIQAAQSALAELFARRAPGAPIPDAARVRSLVGAPDADYYAGLLPAGRGDLFEEARRRVLAREVRLLKEGRAGLFPGIPELLSELLRGGHRLGLVTHAGGEYFRAALRATGLERWLHVAFCMEDGPAGKLELVKMALRELGKPAVMVGDRDSDWRAGHAHGLTTIGCLWGFGCERELQGADRLARDPAHLRDLLLG